MRAVEWLGLTLPKSHPVIFYVYPFLAPGEREALDAVETALVAMIRFHGKTAFQVGPQQGFSRWYRWEGRNRYVEQMTESDAAILFRGGINEYQQFRDLDRPDHRQKTAPYPSEALMRAQRVHDATHGTDYGITPKQARIVARLLKRAMRTPAPITAGAIGARLNDAFLDPEVAEVRLRQTA